MILYNVVRGEAACQYCQERLEMHIGDYEINAFDRIEIYGLGLSEAGPDYCEFRVYDCHDKLVALRRAESY